MLPPRVRHSFDRQSPKMSTGFRDGALDNKTGEGTESYDVIGRSLLPSADCRDSFPGNLGEAGANHRLPVAIDCLVLIYLPPIFNAGLPGAGGDSLARANRARKPHAQALETKRIAAAQSINRDFRGEGHRA